MPKRGGGRNHRQWRSDNRGDHFDHDDRAGGQNVRRVSFKTATHRGRNRFRTLNADPTKYLSDADINMAGTVSVRNKGFQSNRGTRYTGHKSGAPRRQFVPSLMPWYQIKIPYGAKHEKDAILKALLSYVSPEVFIPHCYKTEGNAAIFYVDDAKTARRLCEADRKIVMPDGFKLIVLVNNSVPNVTVNAEMKEKMKMAMAKRYNAANRALDLTKFHADPDLTDIFCGLFRPVIMVAAIDIIAENIPDLEALNLNDNKLHGMEHMKVLHAKLKNLKILYLGDNKIPHVASLLSMKPLPLVELYLKGNPLVNRFRDHEMYISDVRKLFPNLQKLDGEDLLPAIGFDLTAGSELPPPQQSFLVDPLGKDLVREFLTQYFAIYDSDSRQALLDAYHENALMSLSCNYLSNDARNVPATRLNAYLPCSRNLLRVNDRETRRKHLKVGRLNVVSFLSNLPKTNHDLMGFNVDLSLFTPSMIMLTMNGVFKEPMAEDKPTRSFHRTFIIVPNASGGFSIVNDMMNITNTVLEQEKRAFKSATAGPPVVTVAPVVATVAPVVAPVAPVVATAAVPAAALDDAQKMQAISMIAMQTGMNDSWSLNCLQETEWDLQRALFIFNKLQSEGKIPPEAFIR